MKLDEIKKYGNKKIAILGFGKEGKSTLKFLGNLGIKSITILDSNSEIQKEEGIEYVLGKDYLNHLGDFDLIFRSPGISPYNELIANYKGKLTTQSQIFFNNYEGKVIGITGTKGKSTTSSLCYEVLKTIGYSVKLVGNIGNPVLEEIDIINGHSYDYIIYELSSYMLEGLDVQLYIGVINNIYDCHLNWHLGRENYEKAKYGVINNSKNKLINFELKSNLKSNQNNILYFGEDGNYSYINSLFYINEQEILKNLEVEKIRLQGDHNKKNICVIVGILDIIDSKNLNTNLETLKEVLFKFNGLSHRMEEIGIYQGIKFIDDAIATTPESTIAAIKTYGYNIGTILLGGEDSGFNYQNLKEVLKKYKIPNIVLFPDTGEKIFGDLSKYKYETTFKLEGDYNPLILKTKTLKSAVEFSYKNTESGKICILSNGAPSFSLWSGFIAKGLEFQKEVKNYVLK